MELFGCAIRGAALHRAGLHSGIPQLSERDCSFAVQHDDILFERTVAVSPFVQLLEHRAESANREEEVDSPEVIKWPAGGAVDSSKRWCLGSVDDKCDVVRVADGV